jgi:hypothetical protein|tara:strand:- start:1784 stop:1963 length:180 start_codon:yes stop_codon:yes gene_type:complete
MGRKRIYFTEDERKEAQRRWQLEYYYRNRERLKKEARERYRKKNYQIMENERVKKLYGE